MLGFHLYAMAPDLLFRGGVPHHRWMDVFLGHVAAHYVPGGDATWLVLALSATGAYILALTLWLRARRAEALAGMPPGAGVTGAAVLHSQLDPRRSELRHEHHQAEHHGDGPPTVVLLHGLGASASFWRPVARRLAARGQAVLVPDLLGFAGSVRLGTHFHLDDQVAAVVRLLEAQTRPGSTGSFGVSDGDGATGGVVLVGHSYGAVVAVAVAAERPDLLDRLVLVCPPVFADPDRVRQRISGRSWLAGKTMSGSPVAGVVCGGMCLLRRPLTALAPGVASRVSPDIPAAVARDAVNYVWPAYRDALTSLLEGNPLDVWLVDPALPTVVVLGARDATVLADEARRLLGPAIGVVELDGTHALPVDRPDDVAAAIAASPGSRQVPHRCSGYSPLYPTRRGPVMTLLRRGTALAGGVAALAASALLTGPAATADPGTAPAPAVREQPVPGMQRMHALMTDANPGMRRMHELMTGAGPQPR